MAHGDGAVDVDLPAGTPMSFMNFIGTAAAPADSNKSIWSMRRPALTSALVRGGIADEHDGRSAPETAAATMRARGARPVAPRPWSR